MDTNGWTRCCWVFARGKFSRREDSGFEGGSGIHAASVTPWRATRKNHSVRDAGHVSCANESESHCRAEGRPRAGIASAEDARHVGPRRVQAGDRVAIACQYLPVAVRAQPGERAEIAGEYPDAVERRLVDRGEARIGTVVRVPLISVVGIASAPKIRILALLRK